MDISIRGITKEDWPAVTDIWRQGIDAGTATFRTQPTGYDKWAAGHLPFCRLAAVRAGTVVGWTALSPVYSVPAYSGLAELSVYVDAAHRRAGVGGALMAAVVEQSEQNGIWTLESSIIADNTASIALHEHFGFSVIGRRERVARDKWGNWRDTVLMDRRSGLARYR